VPVDILDAAPFELSFFTARTVAPPSQPDCQTLRREDSGCSTAQGTVEAKSTPFARAV